MSSIAKGVGSAGVARSKSDAGMGAIARSVLAGLSFVIYAAAVLSLHQERTAPFVGEQDGPIPAVVSHWLYGAPFGMEDSGLHEFFVHGVPADTAVERAFQGAATASHELSVVRNGNGIGGPIVVELAFLLFGHHARALPMFFLLLIGISTACFAARYRDERLSAIPTVLLALTLLLITPLSGPPRLAYAQAPIGGVRYYAVIGVLPALHWCLEFYQNGGPRPASRLMRWMLLCAQTAILGLSILVRSSPIYLLLPVAASAALALRFRRSKSQRRLILMQLLIPAAVLLIGIRLLVPLAFPEYASAGRVFQNVWHRVFVSLGVHPAWPFPGLRERYTCPSFAGYIGPGFGDENAGCVWWDYGRRHGLSDLALDTKLYDSDYETVLRTAFFDAVRIYPRETFETFFYYKPKLTLEQIVRVLRPQWPGAGSSISVMVLLQIILVIAFIAARPPPAPLRDAARRAWVLGLFVVPSLIPQLVAWTLPWTAIDLFVYVLCGCEIGLWLAISYAFRWCRRGRLHHEGPGMEAEFLFCCDPRPAPSRGSCSDRRQS